MTTQKSVLTGLSLCVFLFVGCGGSGSQDKESTAAEQSPGGVQDEPQSVEEAMNQVQKALQGEGKAVEVVDFRELKALLPEELAGLKRSSHSGEKAGMFGINVSTASAEYRDGDQSLEVSAVDVGGVSMALAGMASWASMEGDRETDTGYERTTMIGGYKAFEKYDKAGKYGEVSVIVENRFVLTVKGSNVEEKVLAKAIDQLDIKKLARLK